MSEHRPVFFFFFIGINRTGKSVTAQTYASLWSISNPNGVIGGYDPQGRFKEMSDPRYVISAGEKGWWFGTKERAALGRRPLCELRNALIICDDMRGLNKHNQTIFDLDRLMEFRAEYCIDIIMIVHQPGHILSSLSGYVSRWFIFYTKGKDDKFESKIDTYQECVMASEIMKAYVKKYPSVIEDPDQFYDTTNHGKHRFPHIMIDTDTRTVVPQNINGQWLEAQIEQIKANPPKL